MMDEISKAWFSKCCEVDLLKLKGDEFQNFFSSVMEKSHSLDFVRVKPWGPLGDRKCDGYLSSKKLLFQVYAPDSMTLKEAEAKIDEDFTKALPFWGDDLQIWAFVHNGSQGISADILKKLETMKTAHPSKKIIPCGPEWLLREVMGLDESHLTALFGFSPSSRAIQEVRAADIQALLNKIMVSDTLAEADLTPVPIDKMDFNAFSPEVRSFIELGRRKEKFVENLLGQWPDPLYPDRVGTQFKRHYMALKSTGSSPDETYHELQKFAGGSSLATVREQAAVFALLSYLFFHCDIFESK